MEWYLSIVLKKEEGDLIDILMLSINVEQTLYIADILFTLNMHFLWLGNRMVIKEAGFSSFFLQPYWYNILTLTGWETIHDVV